MSPDLVEHIQGSERDFPLELALNHIYDVGPDLGVLGHLSLFVGGTDLGAEVARVLRAFALAGEHRERPAELDDAQELRGNELGFKLLQLVSWWRIWVHQHQSLGLVDKLLLEASNVFGSSPQVFFLGIGVKP